MSRATSFLAGLQVFLHIFCKSLGIIRCTAAHSEQLRNNVAAEGSMLHYWWFPAEAAADQKSSEFQ